MNINDEPNIDLEESLSELQSQPEAPKKVRLKHVLFAGISTTLVAILMVGGFFLTRESSDIPELDPDAVHMEQAISAYSNAEAIMDEIKGIYAETYTGETPDTNKMIDGAIAGFVAGTGDKYGAYLPPEQTTEYFNKMIGITVGIGVSVAYEETDDFKGLYVTSLSDDSPAGKGGIKVGDYIMSVNGQTLNDLTYNEFVDKVRGELGTQVDIGVLSNGETKTYSITRGTCSVKTVDYSINDGIGYIKISNFESTTSDEFKAAMTALQSAGTRKYIFDLRNNTGGLVASITNILDYMLPEGLIVKITDKTQTITYNSDDSEVTGDMVVLTNSYTASAAELFTLALKDYGKAISIGEKTFGKGTQVTTVPLSNGGSLILTSGTYYTKTSPNIDGVGIEPDIKVKMDDDKEKILYRLPISEDEQYQAAVKYLYNK